MGGLEISKLVDFKIDATTCKSKCVAPDYGPLEKILDVNDLSKKECFQLSLELFNSVGFKLIDVPDTKEGMALDDGDYEERLDGNEPGKNKVL